MKKDEMMGEAGNLPSLPFKGEEEEGEEKYSFDRSFVGNSIRYLRIYHHKRKKSHKKVVFEGKQETPSLISELDSNQ